MCSREFRRHQFLTILFSIKAFADFFQRFKVCAFLLSSIESRESQLSNRLVPSDLESSSTRLDTVVSWSNPESTDVASVSLSGILDEDISAKESLLLLSFLLISWQREYGVARVLLVLRNSSDEKVVVGRSMTAGRQGRQNDSAELFRSTAFPHFLSKARNATVRCK